MDYAKRQVDYSRSQEETARRQEETARRQEETARETARRQEVGVAQWMRDLRAWASEAIDVLSEAIYASEGMQEPVPSEARRYIRHVSALIDRGRFFLPNQYTDKYGTHKLPAFRGFRHAALDPLVAAVFVLEGSVKKDKRLHDYVVHNRRAVLWELRMEFVSHIQQILDPQGHNEKIAEIIKDSEKQAEKILGKKDVGYHTIDLVRIVVKRLGAKEGSRRVMERQEEAPPEST